LPSRKYYKRYEAKTKKSRELFQRARRSTPGGVESNIRYFQPYPFFVDYGDGGYLFDVDGNEILDLMMGYGALFLGHNNRDVAISVIQQLECGSMMGTSTEVALDYYETIKDAIPSIEKVRLTNSGSEATMHCMRVARAYTGKTKIAKAEGAYHGTHDYALQSVEMPKAALKRMKGYEPLPFGRGIPPQIKDTVCIYPFNDPEGTLEALEANADDLAAVIVEPVMCGAGVVPPRNGYLKRLRRMTRQLDILLIFDEVLTGFRLAYGGAQEYYGVRPDLTTFGKIAGGGFQLGGFGGRDEIMDVLSPGKGTFHAGTYNAHPISIAGGLKTLEILKEEEPYPRLEALGKELFRGLEELGRDRGLDVLVQYVGNMGCIYFTDLPAIRNYRDSLSQVEDRWFNWFIYCLGMDVMMGIPSTNERMFLCTEHDEEDIQTALEVADQAFKVVAAGTRKKVPSVLTEAMAGDVEAEDEAMAAR
jgi:glutamate-1-semialdehyde 2,1-aminomutase